MRKRTMNEFNNEKSGKGGKVRKHLTTVRRNVEERRCRRCCGESGRCGKSGRWCGHQVSPNIFRILLHMVKCVPTSIRRQSDLAPASCLAAVRLAATSSFTDSS